MSRYSKDGKPFYVDVGTSMVAVRCASNHDVIVEYDHARCPQIIKIAEDMCNRMNREVGIGRPIRNCDIGNAEEQLERYGLFCQNKCPICENRHSCHICGERRRMKCIMEWAQMPYYEEGGSK